MEVPINQPKTTMNNPLTRDMYFYDLVNQYGKGRDITPMTSALMSSEKPKLPTIEMKPMAQPTMPMNNIVPTMEQPTNTILNQNLGLMATTNLKRF
jgi:hypothetical protein